VDAPSGATTSRGPTTRGPISRCPTCGFDPTEWTRGDATRTLAHADALLAEWSAGEVTAAEIDAGGALPDQVHALWHRLVAIAELRRSRGDASPSQRGAVAQLNRSGGGVPKLPVDSVAVGWRGLDGDVQRTRVHHGRPWQALCLWSADVIDVLAAEGHAIEPGAAGENVTIRGLDWSLLRGGAVVDIGTVRCRLSAPTTPCRKIRRWFRDGEFGRIDHDRHPGWSRWYAAVLRPGSITTGDAVHVEPRPVR
jgi:MOSC domain-containing protein YiiM